MATRVQQAARHRKSEIAKAVERADKAREKSSAAKNRVLRSLGMSARLNAQAQAAAKRGDYDVSFNLKEQSRKAFKAAVEARDAARKFIYRKEIAEREAARKKQVRLARQRELAAARREERRLERENKFHRRFARLAKDMNAAVAPHIVDERKTGANRAPSIDTRTFKDKLLGRAGRDLTDEEKAKQKELRRKHFYKMQAKRWKKDEEKEKLQRSKINASFDKDDERIGRHVLPQQKQEELNARIRAQGKFIDLRAMKKNNPAGYAEYKKKKAVEKAKRAIITEEKRREAARRKLMSHRPIRGAADAVTKGQKDVMRAFGKATTEVRRYTVKRDREKAQKKLAKKNAKRARLRAAIQGVTGIKLSKNQNEIRSERNQAATKYKELLNDQKERKKSIKEMREKLKSELLASGMSDPSVVEALKEMKAEHDDKKKAHEDKLNDARQKKQAHVAAVADLKQEYQMHALYTQKIDDLEMEINSGKHKGKELERLKKELAGNQQMHAATLKNIGAKTQAVFEAKQATEDAYEEARAKKADLKEAKERLKRAQADSPEAAAIRASIKKTEEAYENAKAHVALHKKNLIDKQTAYDNARKPGWLARQKAKLSAAKAKIKGKIADLRDKYHRIPLFGKKKKEKKKHGIAYLPMSGGTAYGSALLLGMQGHRMPNAAEAVNKTKKEAAEAAKPKSANEAPGPMHKGPKGGIFYYNSAGHKVYVGGQSGFKGMLSMFSAGKTGKRLFS